MFAVFSHLFVSVVKPFLYAVFLSIGLLWSLQASAAPDVKSFGWYHWPPYQEQDNTGRVGGLDIQLLHAIAKQSKLDIQLVERSWPEQLPLIFSGEQDFTVGFKTPSRLKNAHFSQAIRTETNVLYVRRGESKKYNFNSVDTLIQQIKQGFRLGAVANYAYGPDSMRQFLASGETGSIVFSQSDLDNFQKLFNGEIDGFLTDRTVAADLAWVKGWQSQVEEHPAYFVQEDVYLIASKKTVSQESMRNIDNAITTLKHSGEYDQILQSYLTPVLLSMTLSQPWFTLLDIVGTIAFAISGLVLARRGHYSIFGALVLASLPAVGGGIIRDLLVDRDPVGVLRSPLYILLIFGTVIGGYIVYRIIDTLKPQRQQRLVGVVGSAVEVFDAIGLAAFTVVGVVVAVEAQLQPLWLWGPLLAALTGAGGGIMRDVVRADVDNPALKKSFYAEVALIWGLILSGFLVWQARYLDPNIIFYMVVFNVIGAVLTRLLIVKFKVTSPRF